MMEKKKNMSPNDATRWLQHDIFLCSVASFIRRGSVSSWVWDRTSTWHSIMLTAQESEEDFQDVISRLWNAPLTHLYAQTVYINSRNETFETAFYAFI